MKRLPVHWLIWINMHQNFRWLVTNIMLDGLHFSGVELVFAVMLIQSYHGEIDGSVQNRRSSSASTMDLRLSCTNPSKPSVFNDMQIILWDVHDFITLFDNQINLCLWHFIIVSHTLITRALSVTIRYMGKYPSCISLWPLENHFENTQFQRKHFSLNKISKEYYSKGSQWWQISFGLDNGLLPNKH